MLFSRDEDAKTDEWEATRGDRMRNEYARGSVGVTSIVETMREL